MKTLKSNIVFDLGDIGLSDKVKIRNLWRQEDMGIHKGKYRVTLPAHGAALLKCVSFEK
ncbi:MAG: hypothetical protein U5R06_00230 [candidate division KSB1 bacterium]|nr:hypothetical protein [candidate division KSB1 bacterium]